VPRIWAPGRLGRRNLKRVHPQTMGAPGASHLGTWETWNFNRLSPCTADVPVPGCRAASPSSATRSRTFLQLPLRSGMLRFSIAISVPAGRRFGIVPSRRRYTNDAVEWLMLSFWNLMRRCLRWCLGFSNQSHFKTPSSENSHDLAGTLPEIYVPVSFSSTSHR
jgi:hypothetical protein